MASRTHFADWGLLIACNLIWGGQFVFVKIVRQQVGPLFATVVPLGLTVLILAFMVEKRDHAEHSEGQVGRSLYREFAIFFLLGVPGQAASMLLGTWAIGLILAANAALINLALPVTTAVMAYFLLGERMTFIRVLSFALAVAGVLECAGIDWSSLSFSGSRFIIGNALGFLAVVASAFHNSYSKTVLSRYSVLRVVLYTDSFAFFFLLPFALKLEPQSFRNILHLSASVWVGLLFLALLRNLFALVLFFKVLKRLDATVVGLSNYLIPFFGVLTSAVFLQEKLTAYMLLGGLLVLCSTLLITVSDGRKARTLAALKPEETVPGSAPTAG